MRVCVLGATGFIGGQIARAACQTGWQVVAVRRDAQRCGAISDLNVTWRTATLHDAAALTEALRGCDIAFHAAASYPFDSRPDRIAAAIADARQEMERVLQCARAAGVQRLIYTSSLSTVAQRYEPGMKPLNESSHYQPGSLRSAYYEAKWVMEQIALASPAPEVVALLPTAVFGRGDVKPTTGVVIREAARGRVPIYFDAIINCVDVRDVASAHIAAASRGRAGERYIIGGHNLTMRELLETVDRCQGLRRRRARIPRSMIRAIADVASALPWLRLPDHIRAFEFWAPIDSQKAAADLGHQPRPFHETVRDTLRWFGFEVS